MNTILVGAQFGDEGKGTTVDYLTRKLQAKTIVRFNGGAQAGHKYQEPFLKMNCKKKLNASG